MIYNYWRVHKALLGHRRLKCLCFASVEIKSVYLVELWAVEPTDYQDWLQVWCDDWTHCAFRRTEMAYDLPLIGFNVQPLNRADVVLAVIATNGVNELIHCNSWKCSPTMEHRCNRFPLIEDRVIPLYRWKAAGITWTTISSHGIHLVVWSNHCCKFVSSAQHRWALVPLHISKVQVLHSILHLTIIASYHQHNLLAVAQLEEHRGKSGLGLAHFDIWPSDPALAFYVKNLDVFDTLWLRVFSSKNEKAWDRVRPVKLEIWHCHCLELGPCSWQWRHFSPFTIFISELDPLHAIQRLLTVPWEDIQVVLKLLLLFPFFFSWSVQELWALNLKRAMWNHILFLFSCRAKRLVFWRLLSCDVCSAVVLLLLLDFTLCWSQETESTTVCLEYRHWRLLPHPLLPCHLLRADVRDLCFLLLDRSPDKIQKPLLLYTLTLVLILKLFL